MRYFYFSFLNNLAHSVKDGFNELNNKIESVSKKQKILEASKSSNINPILSGEPQPSTSIQHDDFDMDHDEDYYDYADANTEADFIEDEEEILSQNLFKEVQSNSEVNLKPKIMFCQNDIPKIYSEISKVTSPVSQTGNFSIKVSDHIICLLKGIKKHQGSAQKFDIISRDTDYNNIFSHVNSKFAATEVPEDCFRISVSARPALTNAYKTLAKNQMILKNLILHAEMAQDKFSTKDNKEAQELIKIFIIPIEAQLENIHDCIRRIRSIALPRFIPLSLKRTIISAPIIPSKIWNIPPQIQGRIHAARADYARRFNPKPNSSSRETRFFPTRGRFFDRRSRPQRRGGPFRRRYTDPKHDNNKNSTDKN